MRITAQDEGELKCHGAPYWFNCVTTILKYQTFTCNFWETAFSYTTCKMYILFLFPCHMTLHLCPLSCLHSFREQNEVLTEDREKLRVLQPLQPWFTKEQREELAEVHPWIQQHTIPQEIDTQVGIYNHTSITKPIHLSTHLSKGLNDLRLTGLCKLQRRCRRRPLPSASCPRQLIPTGEPSAGPHRTRDGHLKDPEAKITSHPVHSEPALPKTLKLPPCISSDQSWGVGPLCFRLNWYVL